MVFPEMQIEISLQTIYSTLSNSANSWLSSQNAGAQQLQANIDYLKNSFGSVLAPVIEYVVNLVYQLMKAIQSLVYALSGVNIFANASAICFIKGRLKFGNSQGSAPFPSALIYFGNELNREQEKCLREIGKLFKVECEIA